MDFETKTKHLDDYQNYLQFLSRSVLTYIEGYNPKCSSFVLQKKNLVLCFCNFVNKKIGNEKEKLKLSFKYL